MNKVAVIEVEVKKMYTNVTNKLFADLQSDDVPVNALSIIGRLVGFGDPRLLREQLAIGAIPEMLGPVLTAQVKKLALAKTPFVIVVTSSKKVITSITSDEIQFIEQE